ncbi:RNA polymerase II transcription factor SIII subunit A-domain-containing protein [Aspergillus ambiguus]|uniref:elongin A domain-containing protein n=1 Tax=Aspergillus ambiguus TaxID=176160 RepID=UPI003CCDABBE
MPAPSLLQLATASATRNVKFLNDIGTIPYSLARPFLLKIESPEKLRTLELQSPHLIKEDEELWLEFIKRDIPRWEEYELPDSPDCWYEVYCDLRERVQRAVDEDAERMKMALDGIKTERAKHSAKFVTDRREIRLPREQPTTKQRYASFDRKVGGIRPVFAGPRSALGSSDPSGTPLWSFERPQLPRETKKKKSIFTATKRNNVLAVPTKQLNNRASQVKQAPRSLVEEHIRPPPTASPRRKEPAVAGGTPSLRVPGRSRMQGGPGGRIQSPVATPSLQEREARLRAIASGPRAGSHSSMSPAASNTASRASSAAASPSMTAPLPAGSPQSKTRVQLSTPGNSTSPRMDGSAEDDDSRTPPQPPRVVNIRKRPAPSVFIQPKKRKPA